MTAGARSTSDCMYSRACALQLAAARGWAATGRAGAPARSWKSARSLVRHAEQLADHQRRDGQREALDQIDGRARRPPSRRGARSTISVIRGSSRLIRRMVNSGVSMRRSRWCSGGSRPSRLPARALACSSSGMSGAPGSDEPRWARVGEVLVVGQHRLDVVVAGDQVDLHAEGVDDRLRRRRPRRISPSSGVGIEGVAAHVHRWQRGSRCGHAFDGTDGFVGRHGPAVSAPGSPRPAG